MDDSALLQATAFRVERKAVRGGGVHDRKVRSMSTADLPLAVFRHTIPKDGGEWDGGGLEGT